MIDKDNQYWRYRAMSVTKYNPDNRDSNGYYTIDEWTAISDVGKLYENVRFSMDEYLRVESAYINAIRHFMDYLDVKNFRLLEVAKMKKLSVGISNRLETGGLVESYSRIRKGKSYSKDELESLAKIALRECVPNISFMLDLQTCSRVYFGYDYYMYFVSDADLNPLAEDIRKLGLYMY